MEAHVLPALATVLVWWGATGTILYLDRLPPHTFRASLLAATAILVASLLLLHGTRDDASLAGAYLAFVGAIGVWAWQEVGFLLGYVTGPRRLPCPPGSRGWNRARLAFATILHHEIAVVLLAAAVVYATWGGANLTGLWTFLVLWAMRQSAKLNLFFGVRNLGSEFLPGHLDYLQTYFLRRPINPLLPFSILVPAVAAGWVWHAALASADGAQSASLSIIGTLLALAALEHVFMLLPLSTLGLWRWGNDATGAARAEGRR